MKSPHIKPTVSQKQSHSVSIPNDVLSQIMKEVLFRGAQFKFRATGLSMLPFIKEGDILTVSSAQHVKPGYGKIVAFTRFGSDQLLVHRIIGKKDSHFKIQGDNTISPSVDVVSPNNIIGCVTAVEREGRPISFGLGIERYAIATLSRNGWLKRILYYITK